MIAYAGIFNAPRYAGDKMSISAAVRSARGHDVILCDKAHSEVDIGAGREYYECSFPQLRISRRFSGYTVEWRSAWDNVKTVAGGAVIRKPLMLQCAEQFMELLSDTENAEKLPSCVEWE